MMKRAIRSRKSKKQLPDPRAHCSDQAVWFKDVIEYCDSVIDGSIPNAQPVISACAKFKKDYDSFLNDDSFKYKFDFAKAYKVIAFIELLPHVKGKLARKTGKERLIKLEPWQKFIVANIFGWVFEAENLRRYSVAYIRVPRKNGKSLLAAGIGLYMLCADGEAGAEVYCGAGSLDQAKKVFEPAGMMVDKTQALRKRYKIDNRASSIRTPDGSKLEPIIGKPGDGASPSCAIVDEYHEHDSDYLYETMFTGMGAREQPLMLVITTAGENLFSPCREMDKDACNMLDGTLEWPELFAVCYGIDEDDDWTHPSALKKANPNYDVSVVPSYIEAAQQLATKKPSKQNSFKTKHLNVWCNTKNAYFNALNWLKCHKKGMTLDDFMGETCFIGLDLAKKRDLSAKVIVFKQQENGRVHYYIFTRFYISESQITEQPNEALKDLFEKWQNEGWINVCPGNEQDFGLITEEIIEDSHNFDVEEVPHDPHGASQISHELQKSGLVPVAISQHGSMLTIPINELEAAIDSGRIHHDGNPVMAWCIANTIVHEYKGGGKMPDKQDNDSKIDGVSALLCALNRAIDPEPVEDIDDFLNDPIML